MEVTGIVQAITSKERTTRYGLKKVYAIFLDNGEYYHCGFKKPAVADGDVVAITFTVDTYGNQVESVVKSSAPTPAAPAPAAPSPRPAPYSSKGVFPVPITDGQRAIIRQNALLHASKLVTDVLVQTRASNKMTTMLSQKDFEDIAEHVVDIARLYEAYAAGDSDLAAIEEQAGIDA